MHDSATRALLIAQAATEELASSDTPFTFQELDSISFAIETAAASLERIASDCLMPLSAISLPQGQDAHERAVAALQAALQAIGRASPLKRSARRVLSGIRLIISGAISALESADSPAPCVIAYAA